ncbi:MAG: nuclear transport factor 2 family protein [Paracoccaceae bacterium]
MADLDHPYDAIRAVMADYFDGLYHSDTTRLRRVFHPLAQYVCATETPLLYRTMAEYFPVVDARPSPAGRREIRRDEIVEIAFAGPVTATVRAHCAIGGKYFTDCLTLIRTEGRWQVISKVFHYEMIPS